MVTLFLAGCAASGPKLGELQQSGGIPTLREGLGRIYFYREDSIVGGAVRPEIKLDGVVVGQSVPGGFFFVDVSAGTHTASTATEVENVLTIVVARGETVYVKTSVSLGAFVGHVTPTVADTAEAQKLMGSLSFTGTAGAKPPGNAPAMPAAASTLSPQLPKPSAGAQLVRIMGADFQARLIENQTFRALAPSGRTLEITMASGNLTVHNVEKNAHGSGSYQIDQSNSTLCFSKMSHDSTGMAGCYVMFRIDDTTVELSLPRGYSIRYAMSAALAGAVGQPASAVLNPSAPITSYDIVASPSDMAPSKYQAVAESLGERQLCTSHPHANVIMIDHGTEFYAIACDAGDRLMIKCAAGECHPLQ